MNTIKNIFNVSIGLMILVLLLLLPVLWFAGGGAGAGKVENGIYYVADHRIYKPVNFIVYWYLFVLERCWLTLAAIAMPYLLSRTAYLLVKKRPLDDVLDWDNTAEK